MTPDFLFNVRDQTAGIERSSDDTYKMFINSRELTG